MHSTPMAWRNPALATLRTQERQDLIQATLEALEKVRGSVLAKRVRKPEDIGVRVGRVVNRYKVAKHIELTIEQDRFEFRAGGQRGTIGRLGRPVRPAHRAPGEPDGRP